MMIIIGPNFDHALSNAMWRTVGFYFSERVWIAVLGFVIGFLCSRCAGSWCKSTTTLFPITGTSCCWLFIYSSAE